MLTTRGDYTHKDPLPKADHQNYQKKQSTNWKKKGNCTLHVNVVSFLCALLPQFTLLVGYASIVSIYAENEQNKQIFL